MQVVDLKDLNILLFIGLAKLNWYWFLLGELFLKVFKVCLAAAHVHRSTLLSFRVGTPNCYSKLGVVPTAIYCSWYTDYKEVPHTTPLLKDINYPFNKVVVFNHNYIFSNLFVSKPNQTLTLALADRVNYFRNSVSTKSENPNWCQF